MRRAIPLTFGRVPAAFGFATFIPKRCFATRYFSDSHEWIEIDGTKATIGITDHAQEALGEVVYIGLPQVGDDFEAGAVFGEIESVKATNDVYIPCTGTISEVNEAVKSDPSLVNKSPESDGWLLKMDNAKVPEGLMNAEAYKTFIEGH